MRLPLFDRRETPRVVQPCPTLFHRARNRLKTRSPALTQQPDRRRVVIGCRAVARLLQGCQSGGEHTTFLLAQSPVPSRLSPTTGSGKLPLRRRDVRSPRQARLYFTEVLMPVIVEGRPVG